MSATEYGRIATELTHLTFTPPAYERVKAVLHAAATTLAMRPNPNIDPQVLRDLHDQLEEARTLGQHIHPDGPSHAQACDDCGQVATHWMRDLAAEARPHYVADVLIWYCARCLLGEPGSATP